MYINLGLIRIVRMIDNSTKLFIWVGSDLRLRTYNLTKVMGSLKLMLTGSFFKWSWKKAKKWVLQTNNIFFYFPARWGLKDLAQLDVEYILIPNVKKNTKIISIITFPIILKVYLSNFSCYARVDLFSTSPDWGRERSNEKVHFN